jgi:hypothetical protein
MGFLRLPVLTQPLFLAPCRVEYALALVSIDGKAALMVGRALVSLWKTRGPAPRPWERDQRLPAWRAMSSWIWRRK